MWRCLLASLTLLALTPACLELSDVPQCSVYEVSDLERCEKEVDQGLVQRIAIYETLDCSEERCKLTLKDVDGIELVGLGGGFVRQDGYTDSIIDIINSKNVTVLFLNIDDGPLDIDPATNRPSKVCKGCYASGIRVKHSENVAFLGLNLKGGKPHNMEFSGNKGITVALSDIDGAAEFGMWFDHERRNELVSIAHNRFTDNRSNAVIFSGKDAHITGNVFTHNHYGSAFNQCGPNKDEYCNGGQLLVYSCEDVVIEGNEFREARLDEFEDRSAIYNFVMDIEMGLEPRFNGDGTRRVLIRDNQFYYDAWNDGRKHLRITQNNEAVFDEILIENNELIGFPEAQTSDPTAVEPSSGLRPEDYFYLRPGSLARDNVFKK